MEVIEIKVNFKDNSHQTVTGENTFTHITTNVPNSIRSSEILLNSMFRRGTGDLGNVWNVLTSKGIISETVDSIEVKMNNVEMTIENIADISYNVGLTDWINSETNQTEVLFLESLKISTSTEEN